MAGSFSEVKQEIYANRVNSRLRQLYVYLSQSVPDLILPTHSLPHPKPRQETKCCETKTFFMLRPISSYSQQSPGGAKDNGDDCDSTASGLLQPSLPGDGPCCLPVAVLQETTATLFPLRTVRIHCYRYYYSHFSISRVTFITSAHHSSSASHSGCFFSTALTKAKTAPLPLQKAEAPKRVLSPKSRCLNHMFKKN